MQEADHDRHLLTPLQGKILTTLARRAIGDGVRWLWGHPRVRTLAMLVSSFNITFGAAFSVLVILASERLGLDEVGYGLLIGSSAVGAILGAIAFGLLQVVTGALQTAGRTDNGLYHIVEDLFHMPRVMKQLAVVQFFSWFALFSMWIYSTAAVTSHHYGTGDVTSGLYNEGANWVGVLFSVYNGFAALAAFAIPVAARLLGVRRAHLLHLVLGGIGLASFWFIRDPAWLIAPMIGVGIAWASILSLPYALLSDVLPANKMGVYMGIFNFFIVIPQLVAASVLGLVLREFFDLQAIYALVIGGVLMMVSGLATLLVDKSAEPRS